MSGSLLAAQALSPDCAVYGVEPTNGNDAQQSLQQGSIVQIAAPHSIADGALTTALGHLTFALIQRHIRDIFTVPDTQLVQAMQFFSERMKMVVEPTGCLGAAAVMNPIVPVQGQRIGVLLSGGNVDLQAYAGLLQTKA